MDYRQLYLYITKPVLTVPNLLFRLIETRSNRGDMRLSVWLGVSLAYCGLLSVPGVEAGFTPVAFDETGLKCADHEDGVPFPSKDGCHECTCDGRKMQCTYAMCPMVYCHEEMIINELGQCCPICKPGCQTDELGYMKVGQDVTSDGGCKHCTCAEDGKVHCTIEKCLSCEGSHWEDDGSCCGKCDLTTCKVDGGVYNNGDIIPGDGPCKTCFCVADGRHVQLSCATMACAMCLGIHTDDGTCCGSCEMPRCSYKGNFYEIGETMPEKDPCATCFCELTDNGAEPVCMMHGCVPCQGKYINDGSCCGQCIPQCEVRAQPFDIGQEVPTRDPCQTCTCSMSVSGEPEVKCITMTCDMRCPEGFEHVFDDSSCCGRCEPILTPVCDPTQCPKIRCRKNRRFQLPGMCCPLCKCKYRGNLVEPGPFGDKCDGCVCDGFGKVTCNPVVCLKREALQCVDAVKGDDCCYHCPNGKTCGHPKVPNLVIKYGEYVKVKKMYCTCAGEPWFPNAFCSWERTRLLRILGKKYGDKLAEYMKLE